MAKALRTIADLKPSPTNPRDIGVEEFRGLLASLDEFGDLSGIVWNRRTGVLVAGHQRMKALKDKHDKALKLVKDKEQRWWIKAGTDLFSVRVVDWDKEIADAATLAANHTALQGVFTSGARQMSEDIASLRPDLADALRLWQLEIAKDPFEQARIKREREEGGAGPPEMELQPFEHYDYLVVLATNTHEWEALVEILKIERVNSSPLTGKKKIGLGRAIPAARLLDALGYKGPKLR